MVTNHLYFDINPVLVPAADINGTVSVPLVYEMDDGVLERLQIRKLWGDTDLSNESTIALIHTNAHGYVAAGVKSRHLTEGDGPTSMTYVMSKRLRGGHSIAPRLIIPKLFDMICLAPEPSDPIGGMFNFETLYGGVPFTENVTHRLLIACGQYNLDREDTGEWMETLRTLVIMFTDFAKIYRHGTKATLHKFTLIDGFVIISFTANEETKKKVPEEFLTSGEKLMSKIFGDDSRIWPPPKD